MIPLEVRFLITFSTVYGKQINFSLCGLTISRLFREWQRSRGRYSDYASSGTSDRAQRAAASNEDKEVQGKLKVEMRLRYYADLEQRIAFIWGSLCTYRRDSAENRHAITVPKHLL